MESFDQDGFKNNLATVLGETVSPSMITLAVAVASVRVTAEIATNLTMRQAQSTIAATLEAQTTESLSSALGVTVVAMEPPAVVPVSVVESSDTAAPSPASNTTVVTVEADASAPIALIVVLVVVSILFLAVAIFACTMYRAEKNGEPIFYKMSDGPAAKKSSTELGGVAAENAQA